MVNFVDESGVHPAQLIDEVDDYTAYYFTRNANGQWTLHCHEIKNVASAVQALGFLELELQERGISLSFDSFHYVCMVAGGDLADLRDNKHGSPDGFSVFFAYGKYGSPEHRWRLRLNEAEDGVSNGQQAAEYVRNGFAGALLAVVFAHEVPVVDELQECGPTWCTLNGLPPAPPTAPPKSEEHHGLFGRRHRQ